MKFWEKHHPVTDPWGLGKVMRRAIYLALHGLKNFVKKILKKILRKVLKKVLKNNFFAHYALNCNVFNSKSIRNRDL